MFRNYLKIGLRTLRRQPGYAFINLFGLALGIAVAFVLSLYVRQELTYDRHFDDHERIYRIATDFFGMGGFAKSQQQLLDFLPQTTPAVEAATRFDRGFAPTPVRAAGRTFEEARYFFADSAFFDLFSYRFIVGDRATALHAPDEAVLSEALARTYFGRPEAAFGETILVGKEETAYRVSGVVAAPSTPTHLAADLWLPLQPAEPTAFWTNVSYYNYVRLREGAGRAALERGLEALRRTYAYPASQADGSFEAWAASSQAVHFWVQPLTEIYLHSDYNLEIAPGGNPTQVYVLGLIGLLTLLIAGVNYVNLTTARSAMRAREVGVRKTMGAARGVLVRQFLAESVLFSLLAFGVATVLAEAVFGIFAYVAGTPLMGGPFTGVRHLAVLAAFAVGVGLVAGLYPALYLSGFRPARVLKGTWTVPGNQRLRSTLVVLQFAIATVLVISSLVIYTQLDFMRNADKGFDHEGVVAVENIKLLGTQAEAFRQELAQLPQVRRASFTNRTPTGAGVWMRTYQTPEMEEALTIQAFSGDEDYLPTLGMRLVAGRNFSGDLASDSSAVILNEAAVRALGLGDAPLGREVNEGQHVIGVVHNFHFQSLRQQIEPVVITYTPTGRQLLLKLGSRDVHAFITRLTDVWARFVPDEPVRYAFLDDNFAQLAEQERRLSRAVAFFTLLALLIACMGLLGLTAFTVQRRTKEIGIRKVLGAGVGSLVALLAKEFVRLVLVAFLIAAPVAYLAMNRWLEDFAYRVEISWRLFLLAGLAALAVALLTVSYHALRAALADPVKSLRYE